MLQTSTQAVPDKHQLNAWRQQHKTAWQDHAKAYLARPNPKTLFQKNTQTLDKLLIAIWNYVGLNKQQNNTCQNKTSKNTTDTQAYLLAVGGYGRGEMFPHSDIDLLVLLPEQASEQTKAQVEQLIGILWDIGLNVGHGVRTLQECTQEALQDVTVLTNLLEARVLVGPKDLVWQLHQTLFDASSAREFCGLKLREQHLRHAKFNETAYNLEPNIKESPGGLRDLHMVLWMTRRMGLGNSWRDLVKHDILSASEANTIQRHERNLQNLRIRLHLMANRREDRLLFDFQNELAAELGYVTNAKKRASEQLMHGFYQSARAIIIENEVLVKLLKQKLAHVEEIGATLAIHPHFVLENGLLELRHPDVFSQHPEAILESFLLQTKNPQIQGFGAQFIRHLQRANGLIDKAFRQNDTHKQLFLNILNQPESVHRCLRRMNRYGVLGRYIPAFGRVIAQMQHDLFHVYTVDEHTLNVLGNLRRFAKPELKHEFPLCSTLFSEFKQPYLLYLAAIFHDIAKGRGGDHSELGTVDARRFCHLHGLPREQTNLVAWLVEMHLKMSSTAQKSDLSDPEVINQFAQLVQTEERLIALYLLTVADIRGTSPNVWNAWKARLLENLFVQTRRVLKETLNTQTQISLRKQEVIQKLQSFDIGESSVKSLWTAFGDSYFARFDGDQIAWQTRLLMPHQQSLKPIVRARLSPKGDGIQVMIFSPDQAEIFARICHFFESMGYNVAQAQIFTTQHGYALDNFTVLEPETKLVSYNGLLKHIEVGLSTQLDPKATIPAPLKGRVSRQVKHLPISTQVNIHAEDNSHFHTLEIIANDKPGLLALMAHTFLEHNVALHNAKINTLGNRIEDSFLISGLEEQTLTAEQVIALKSAFDQF